MTLVVSLLLLLFPSHLYCLLSRRNNVWTELTQHPPNLKEFDQNYHIQTENKTSVYDSKRRESFSSKLSKQLKSRKLLKPALTARKNKPGKSTIKRRLSDSIDYSQPGYVYSINECGTSVGTIYTQSVNTCWTGGSNTTSYIINIIANPMNSQSFNLVGYYYYTNGFCEPSTPYIVFYGNALSSPSGGENSDNTVNYNYTTTCIYGETYYKYIAGSITFDVVTANGFAQVFYDSCETQNIVYEYSFYPLNQCTYVKGFGGYGYAILIDNNQNISTFMSSYSDCSDATTGSTIGLDNQCTYDSSASGDETSSLFALVYPSPTAYSSDLTLPGYVYVTYNCATSNLVIKVFSVNICWPSIDDQTSVIYNISTSDDGNSYLLMNYLFQNTACSGTASSSTRVGEYPIICSYNGIYVKYIPGGISAELAPLDGVAGTQCGYNNGTISGIYAPYNVCVYNTDINSYVLSNKTIEGNVVYFTSDYNTCSNLVYGGLIGLSDCTSSPGSFVYSLVNTQTYPSTYDEGYDYSNPGYMYSIENCGTEGEVITTQTVNTCFTSDSINSFFIQVFSTDFNDLQLMGAFYNDSTCTGSIINVFYGTSLYYDSPDADSIYLTTCTIGSVYYQYILGPLSSNLLPTQGFEVAYYPQTSCSTDIMTEYVSYYPLYTCFYSNSGISYYYGNITSTGEYVTYYTSQDSTCQSLTFAGSVKLNDCVFGTNYGDTSYESVVLVNPPVSSLSAPAVYPTVDFSVPGYLYQISNCGTGSEVIISQIVNTCLLLLPYSISYVTRLFEIPDSDNSINVIMYLYYSSYCSGEVLEILYFTSFNFETSELTNYSTMCQYGSVAYKFIPSTVSSTFKYTVSSPSSLFQQYYTSNNCSGGSFSEYASIPLDICYYNLELSQYISIPIYSKQTVDDATNELLTYYFITDNCTDVGVNISYYTAIPVNQCFPVYDFTESYSEISVVSTTYVASSPSILSTQPSSGFPITSSSLVVSLQYQYSFPGHIYYIENCNTTSEIVASLIVNTCYVDTSQSVSYNLFVQVNSPEYITLILYYYASSDCSGVALNVDYVNYLPGLSQNLQYPTTCVTGETYYKYIPGGVSYDLLASTHTASFAVVVYPGTKCSYINSNAATPTSLSTASDIVVLLPLNECVDYVLFSETSSIFYYTVDDVNLNAYQFTGSDISLCNLETVVYYLSLPLQACYVLTNGTSIGGSLYIEVFNYNFPTSEPTVDPTIIPTRVPSCLPSFLPSLNPTRKPTVKPSSIPSSLHPSSIPTTKIGPTSSPSIFPTPSPTALSTISLNPSSFPSTSPSSSPTSNNPTVIPSSKPTVSVKPTVLPSKLPSTSPSAFPSISCQPSGRPTVSPSSNRPTARPTLIPTTACPSSLPTSYPTYNPTNPPSLMPTSIPTLVIGPTSGPTTFPSVLPSSFPSSLASFRPSMSPTLSPSGRPSTMPSIIPSRLPTTSIPTSTPTTLKPTVCPTLIPTYSPSRLPTICPSSLPTSVIGPTSRPSILPTTTPSFTPSSTPSCIPTTAPTTRKPSVSPSKNPSRCPTALPSFIIGPTSHPSTTPSSLAPTVSMNPTKMPTHVPSHMPTVRPSMTPTNTSQLTSSSSNSKSKKLSAGAKVGVAIAACVGLVAVLIAVYVMCCSSDKNDREKNVTDNGSVIEATSYNPTAPQINYDVPIINYDETYSNSDHAASVDKDAFADNPVAPHRVYL